MYRFIQYSRSTGVVITQVMLAVRPSQIIHVKLLSFTMYQI